MIETLISYLATNPMLVAGVGTVAVGGLAYVARTVPAGIKNVASRTLTTTLTVNTRNSEFGDVSRLLNACSIPAMMRTFIPSYWDKGISPGYGLGWGRYKGVFMTFQREMMENKGGFEIQERMDIRFFTRDTAIVRTFLKEAEDFCEPGKIKVYSTSEWGFSVLPQKPKRALNTVYMAADVKDRLVTRMGWFIENEKFFLDRGIPYKFCALLYGPPGTGKTSLVHAVASVHGLNIVHVNSLSAVDSIVRSANPAKDMIVIEDIDALADELKRNEAPDAPQAAGAPPKALELKLKDEGNPVLHKLLNALDGFITPHGLKVCITTNHIEKLDPALIRPGRMNVMLEIGPMGGVEIMTMLETFHGSAAADELREWVSLGGRIKSMPGGELQELFATKSPAECIAALKEPALLCAAE